VGAGVVCDAHGRQIGGPHCCEHVLEASYGRTPAGEIAPDPHVVTVQLDLGGDGSVMKEVVLCSECARRFGRVAGEVVVEAEEGEALPWIGPICTPCLERWTAGLPRK
jgi:hypothetical protein